jgi:hypothetical protein
MGEYKKMAKKTKKLGYGDIKKNPYYKKHSIKRPLPLRINLIIRSISCLLFAYSIYYPIAYPLNDGISQFTSLFANIILVWFFIVNERMFRLKNKISRFLIPGAITTFFTFNMVGIFGVHYPVLYELLKDNLFFCYGLPLVMMLISTVLPMNAKIRFYFGTGLGAAILVAFTMIQSLIQHHDLWVFSLERMHLALTYSWICLVIGIVAIFKSDYDARYYEEYLSWQAMQSGDSPKEQNYHQESSYESDNSYNSDRDSYYDDNKKPDNYYSPYTSDKMRDDWDRGQYNSADDFQNDHVYTGGEGGK